MRKEEALVPAAGDERLEKSLCEQEKAVLEFTAV